MNFAILMRWLDWPAWARWTAFVWYSGLVAWMMLAPLGLIVRVLWVFPHVDKVLHFLIYGFLVWLFRWAVSAHRKWVPRFWIVTLGAIAYGSLMEGLQLVLAQYQRSFEWLDILSNILGALCFWWMPVPRNGEGFEPLHQ